MTLQASSGVSTVSVLTQASRLVPAVKALGIDVAEALERGEIDVVVYLLDQAGAGFGYRYEWERYGPFSPELAADLVELTNEDLKTSDAALEPDVSAAVLTVRPIIEPLPNVRQFTWIRLLASLDFLQRYARVPVDPSGSVHIGASFEESTVRAATKRLEGFVPRDH